ncbi:toprim domain-containing protein [Thiothrix nivea]|nr:toprim domain-containing protein [Thiothrix nivea]
MTDKQTGETAPHWGLVGVYGDWRQFGEAKFKWNSFSQYFELSREEKARIESRQRELAAKQKAERQARAETAQNKAVNLWRSSTPADPSHPYLLKKRVGAYGIRQRGEMLLVPVCDLDGVLHGLQFIAPDGNKPYLTGTQPTGKFCLVGQALTHPQGVYLCEGYATAASLHEVYGLPVLSCFAKHNLLPVAQAYRERFPHIPLTLCADNDRDPDSKGYRGGELEARKVCATLPGVSLMIPEFPASAPLELSDFNDLMSLLGSSGEKEPTL